MEEFESKLTALIDCMRKDLQNIGPKLGPTTLSEAAFSHGLPLSHIADELTSVDAHPGSGLSDINTNTHFWDRHFQGRQQV